MSVPIVVLFHPIDNMQSFAELVKNAPGSSNNAVASQPGMSASSPSDVPFSLSTRHSSRARVLSADSRLSLDRLVDDAPRIAWSTFLGDELLTSSLLETTPGSLPSPAMSSTKTVTCSHQTPVRARSACPASPPGLINVASTRKQSSSEQRECQTIPPAFKVLWQTLERYRSRGVSRPLRSKVALEITAQNSSAYKQAGVQRFGQYVDIAVRTGIVEIGGKEGEAWIALCPGWVGPKVA